jgi:hypothetical protein
MVFRPFPGYYSIIVVVKLTGSKQASRSREIPAPGCCKGRRPYRSIDRRRLTNLYGFFVVGKIAVLDRCLDIGDFRGNAG